MLKASEAWRFRVNGNFSGSFLRRVDQTLVLMFSDPEHWATLAGVSNEGRPLWEAKWDGFAHFFVSRGRLFVDGDRARRLLPETGAMLKERDLGVPVYVNWALEAGPVYKVAGGTRYFGLDGDTLETLWEWDDEDEDFTFDEGHLCRQGLAGRIAVHELPSLRQAGLTCSSPVAPGAHAHSGELFCVFSYQEGGRAGINLSTGQVEWHFSEPARYGLTTFDNERAYSPLDGLAAYDLRTGVLLWKRTFGAFPTSRAFVADGRVYIATGDKFVHVVHAQSGELILSHALKVKITGAVEPAPAVPWGDNRIIVGTRREIICLEIE